MAITFDYGVGGTEVSNPPGGDMTWNHILAGGANRIVCVGGRHYNGGTAYTMTAKFNNVAMTSIWVEDAAHQAAGTSSVQFFIMKEADLPAAGTYAVLLHTSAGNVGVLGGGSQSWSGVDQTTTYRNTTGAHNDVSDANPATVNVTSAVSDVVVDVVQNDNLTGSNQTQRWAENTGTPRGSSAAGAGSVTMSYTKTAGDWFIAATSLIPTASAEVAPIIWNIA